MIKSAKRSTSRQRRSPRRSRAFIRRVLLLGCRRNRRTEQVLGMFRRTLIRRFLRFAKHWRCFTRGLPHLEFPSLPIILRLKKRLRSFTSAILPETLIGSTKG